MRISDFLINSNVNNSLEKDVVVSDRFIDDKGNFIPFKIRSITRNELQDISRLTNSNLDRELEIVAIACVEPNFKNIELQNHYGVHNASDLVDKVLLPGEITELAYQILTLSGYNKSFEELVQLAKKQ